MIGKDAGDLYGSSCPNMMSKRLHGAALQPKDLVRILLIFKIHAFLKFLFRVNDLELFDLNMGFHGGFTIQPGCPNIWNRRSSLKYEDLFCKFSDCCDCEQLGLSNIFFYRYFVCNFGFSMPNCNHYQLDRSAGQEYGESTRFDRLYQVLSRF